MAEVERAKRSGNIRIWLDNNWSHEYVDHTFIDDDYVMTVTEGAARSLYKELGELFAENTNEG